MTQAKRTEDEDDRIVHGGELPEDDDSLDIVVDEESEQRRLVVRIFSHKERGVTVTRSGDKSIYVSFSVKGEEGKSSPVYIVDSFIASSKKPFEVPSIEEPGLPKLVDPNMQGGNYVFASTLEDVGYAFVHQRLTKHYMAFLRDFAQANDCELDLSRMVLEAAQLKWKTQDYRKK